VHDLSRFLLFLVIYTVPGVGPFISLSAVFTMTAIPRHSLQSQFSSVLAAILPTHCRLSQSTGILHSHYGYPPIQISPAIAVVLVKD
jgi:hypothetical protein